MLSRDIVVLGWFSDFVHAMIDRTLWARLLFRFVIGKYAYSEFVGALDEMERNHHCPYNIGYSLQDGSWHKRRIRWRWWVQPTQKQLTLPYPALNSVDPTPPT